jgi:hypothetical protein
LQNLAVRSSRASNGKVVAAASAESVRRLTQTPLQPNETYGKTERTWAFAKPATPKAFGARTDLKSKNEASAEPAGEEEFPKTKARDESLILNRHARRSPSSCRKNRESIVARS